MWHHGKTCLEKGDTKTGGRGMGGNSEAARMIQVRNYKELNQDDGSSTNGLGVELGAPWAQNPCHLSSD